MPSGFGQGFRTSGLGHALGYNIGFHNPSTIPLGYLPGLKRDTYAGYFADDLSWFNGRVPASTDYPTTTISDPASDDGENFSRRWTGYFRPTTTETYTFYLNSDDSSWMWLGDPALSGWSSSNEIVDNSGLHGPVEKSGTITLSAGVLYPILIFFGELSVGDELTFSYSTPTIAKTANVSGLVYYNSLSTDSSYRGF